VRLKWLAADKNVRAPQVKKKCNHLAGFGIIQGKAVKTGCDIAQEPLELRLEPETGTVEDERALVLAARTDKEAAAQLYEKYYRPIFRYIYRSTLNHSSTEDLTSNVFLSAFRHLGSFRWRRIPFSAWLYRIATNEVRMYFRRQTRVNLSSLEGTATELPGAASPEDDLVALEQYQVLHRALLELRPKFRTAIILRYFERKPVAEIAVITNRSVGAVKSRLHRGLAELQEILAARGILKTERNSL
jgi:RNA polymerase sigma-70 factor (ECF subfamily)